MAEHVLPEAAVHHDWDAARPPALRIASGDVVHYDLRMAGHGQVDAGDAYEDARFDFDTLYHLAGPVAVDGAEPGDTLEIEVLALRAGAWGWTSILPELGLLPEDFPDGVVRTFPLEGRTSIAFAPGVEVPIRPFLGTVGTTPDLPEPSSPFPPHAGGGNVDTRHLTVGSTLWLPVHLPGAGLSVGDPHAAQGDGEVCVSALECPMRASLRITLRKRSSAVPFFVTAGTPGALGPHLTTMGLGEDLMEGARTAVRAMIGWLTAERGLSAEDAYMLCSLAGDLKLLEVVDAGVWNVGFALPLSLFTE